MRTYLVVANQTLGGEHLIAKVQECKVAGACRFHVIVSATPPSDYTWIEGTREPRPGPAAGRPRQFSRELEPDADGEVGDHSPMVAIGDSLRTERLTRLSCRPSRASLGG